MDNPELSLSTPVPGVPVAPISPGGYPSHAGHASHPPTHPGENPFGGRPPRANPVRSLRKRIGSAIAAMGALLAKFGVAIKALLVALPNLKLLVTAGTALVSVGGFSPFFGLGFAGGVGGLLFVA